MKTLQLTAALLAALLTGCAGPLATGPDEPPATDSPQAPVTTAPVTAAPPPPTADQPTPVTAAPEPAPGAEPASPVPGGPETTPGPAGPETAAPEPGPPAEPEVTVEPEVPGTDPGTIEELDEPARQGEAEPGEFVSSNITAETASTGTMAGFLAYVLTDIDSYWTSVWKAAGYPEPAVSYNFPGPGELYPTLCESRVPRFNDDRSAFYCPADDTIVFSQVMATDVWLGRVRANDDPETGAASGDFSVAYVMAHEYAHNLQSELGLVPSPQQPQEVYPVYKTELHADCWAGVWANSAYYKGILEPGDVEEGQQSALLFGDYAFTEPGHHGTPQQRTEAFLSGYNSGSPSSCDPWLTAEY